MESVNQESLGDQHKYQYNLSVEQMQSMVGDLLERQPPSRGNNIVCYELEEGMSDAARTLECQVFDKAFNNDPTQMSKIYGPYEESSRFFLSVDAEQQRPCGTLRVIENSPAGIMTFNDIPAEASTKTTEEMMEAHQISSLDDCWDVGTVAVLPEYRKLNRYQVSQQLYRALYVSAMRDRVKHFTSIIDDKPYKMMTETLRIPFKPLDGTKPFDFEGSALSHAVHGYVPDFYESMSQKGHSLARWMAYYASRPLVEGTKDDSLMFDTRY